MKQRCGNGERNVLDLQERIGVNSQEEGREVERGGERERARESEGGGGRVHVGACETGDSGAQSVRERES